jgi:hypothetical protein
MVEEDSSTIILLHKLHKKLINQVFVKNRFPGDFMFQLTINELDKLVTKCDRLTKQKHSSVMTHVFKESGVAMLSSVLNFRFKYSK